MPQKHKQKFTVRVVVSPGFSVHLPLGRLFQEVRSEVPVRDVLEVLETNRLKFVLVPDGGAEPTSIKAALECDVVAGVPVSASLSACGWSHRVDCESDATTAKQRRYAAKKRGLIVAPAPRSPAVGEARQNPFFLFSCAMFLCRNCLLREGHMQGGVRLRRAESHRLGRPPDGCLSHVCTKCTVLFGWAASTAKRVFKNLTNL